MRSLMRVLSFGLVVLIGGCGSSNESSAPQAQASNTAKPATQAAAAPALDPRLEGKWVAKSEGSNHLGESYREVTLEFLKSSHGVTGDFALLTEKCIFTKTDGAVFSAVAEVSTMIQAASSTSFAVSPPAIKKVPLVVLDGNQEHCTAVMGSGYHEVEFRDDNTIYESYMMLKFTRM